MWVKICGIRDVTTALEVAGLGADAIGLNFYPGSARNIDLETARDVVRELPPNVTPVGLFVNATADEIRHTCETCGLMTVQLHGDEPPEYLQQLSGLKVIRALRIGADVKSVVTRELEACRELGVRPWAWLVDARVEGAYGGTGEAVDWEQYAPSQRTSAWPPLILAGGLRPENLRAAVDIVCPWGVDVASGVESEPGVKDPRRVAAFVEIARAAS